MATKLAATHMSNLVSNISEVSGLLRIHTELTGQGPGRRHAVEVLNKSGIVLVVACWEAFIEDLVASALKVMIDSVEDPNAFPQEVLERVASKVQGMKAWNLAKDGWKQCLRDHYEEVLARTTGNLNTPKAAQVDDLVEKVLGMKKMSAKWAWAGSAATQNRAKLDSLITLRGSIAHRVEAPKRVHKTTVVNARDLVYRLAVRSHNALNAHVGGRIGTSPWAEFKYEAR